MKVIIIILILLFSSNIFANDDINLTEQIERLQREINELSSTLYKTNNQSNNSDPAASLAAIDLRIYDLEKDIKNITSQIEEILFIIDDLSYAIEDMNINKKNSSTNNEIKKIEDLDERIKKIEKILEVLN